MERGPRYKAYSVVRDKKLRMKYQSQHDKMFEPKVPTPPRKQVRCQVGMQDFNAILKKDNRNAVVNMLPSVIARKSYASIHELKCFSKDIEIRVGGRSSSVLHKTVFGCRHF
ncbi:hypothetical protein TanjilG_08839 [Lupinus angustifolius]|uniref:Uncharacterized protein n=1 Tax=Lupinus angustifolius TaxID=3871 RepID=A0A1J7IFX2_LUPAN|nr:hypothetical protein TanjilG_08839 [Lupinus angustifolius]